MNIKLSGIVILSGGILAMIICGYLVVRLLGYTGVFIGASEIVLPKSLDQRNADRAWLSKSRLTPTWSESLTFDRGYGIEVLPLDNGAILAVKCNNVDGFIYTVDSQGRIFYKDQPVTEMSKWPSCNYLQVRAANSLSIGAAYVVSRVSPNLFAGTDKPLPVRK